MQGEKLPKKVVINILFVYPAYSRLIYLKKNLLPVFSKVSLTEPGAEESGINLGARKHR